MYGTWEKLVAGTGWGNEKVLSGFVAEMRERMSERTMGGGGI